jgi:RNA polymerase sigma-70 factor (ECF subfamily)
MAEQASPASDAGSDAASLGTLTDEALVGRAQRRDLAAFEELVARHEEKIYRLAMRLLRNESDAQEVIQDTFLSAWRNIGSFQGKAQFGSWLYRVAANAALMLLRSQRRRPAISAEDLGPEALDAAAEGGAGAFHATTDWSKRPDHQLQSSELRRHLEAAMDLLPEAQREVVVLRDVEGLSTEETADLLQITIPTVKTRLHRARLSLRDAITAYFERG